MTADNVYAVQAIGGCLGALIPEGAIVFIDPDAEIAPLTLCAVIFKDSARHFSRSARRIPDEAPVNGVGKLLLRRCRMAGRDVLMLAEVSPPAVLLVPVDEIEALHRIVDAEPGLKDAGARELAAMAMLAPFLGEEPMLPIGSEWRPPVEMADDREEAA